MKEKENKKISIKEIAKLANVSVATVSRVINQNGRFSKETEKKVLEIIEKYDYKINMVAKSLRKKETKSIGIIVPNIKNEFFSSIVLEIESYFFAKGYSVLICNTNSEEKKEQEYLRILDSKGVDGLIYISGKGTIPLTSLKRNIPIVCIDRKVEIKENIAIVESDNYRGGYIATEKLINNGCKNILILKSKNKISSSEERFRGYLDALIDNKFFIKEENIIELDNLTFEIGKKIMTDLIMKRKDFDGIFALNDWVALSSLIVLTESGIKVPDEVKIVGFDNISISKYSYPSITTIDQNKKLLGVEASKILLNFITKKEVYRKVHKIVPVTLVERETTG